MAQNIQKQNQKPLVMRSLAMALFMVLLTQFAQAQSVKQKSTYSFAKSEKVMEEQKGDRATITDELTRSLIGVTSNSYTSWSGKTSNSDAVYAGNSAGGNNSIQLRSTTSGGSTTRSGIVTTTSGGTAYSITVTWNSYTSNGRTLDVYGKTTAYSTANDLYSTSTQGTKLGSIVKGTSTTLSISGNYSYIGIRSNSGALYLNEIDITWTTSDPPSITASDVNITTYEATSDEIPVTITNPVTGGTLTATSSESWLTIGTVTTTSVPFTCSANTSFLSRSATITLTYTYNAKASVTQTVTLTQAGNSGSGCPSIDFSTQGYTDQQTITNVTINSDIRATFAQGTGSNPPRYYASGTAIRVYPNNTFTVSTSGPDPITSIELAFGSGDGSNTITTDIGTYSNGTWTGSSASVTFSVGGTSGNRRIAGIEVCTTPNCDYSENFEGVTGTSGYGTAGSLPTGWDYIWNDTDHPAYAPHVYLSSQTGTPGLPSTGNYLGFYASGSTSEYSYAIMPVFAEGEAANHISFKYKFESAGQGTLTYGVIDGTDENSYTILGTISNPNPNPGTVDVALNVSQTAGKRIAFRWYKTSTWYTCGIDDICVMTESTSNCPAPTNVTVSNITPNSASVSWDGEASSYNVRYRTAAGDGETVLYEDFENGIPSTWTKIDSDGDGYNWIAVSEIGTTFTYYASVDLSTWVHGGSNAASSCSYYNNASGSGGTSLNTNQWLITPQVDLKGTLRFYAASTYSDLDSYEVLLSTTGTATSNFTTTLKAMGDATYYSNNWDEVEIDLSAYAGQQGYIAIHHVSNGMYFLLIDDFGIYDDGTAGPWSNPVLTTDENSIPLVNLLSETTYEVQVQANCGEDGLSQWTDAVSFTTLSACAAPGELSAELTNNTAALSWGDYQDSYNVRYRKVFLHEDFESGIPSTWTKIDADNDGHNWLALSEVPSTYSAYSDVSFWAHGGSDAACSPSYYNTGSNSGTALNTNNWLITPLVDLQGTLTFYATSKYDQPDQYEVLLSTTGTATSDFTITLQAMGNATYNSWDEVEIDLSAYAGQQGYIAIHHVSNDKYFLVIDDFGIYSDWTTKPASEATATIGGLSGNTNYEWQVQGVNCDGNGNPTDWSAPATFTTTDLETWVTAVNSKPSTYTAGATVDLHNANDLAWAISVVNGLNGQSAAPGTNFNVVADINMDANNWVPIGTSVNPYTGTFNANGHHIEGLHSLLNTENMGMFGSLNGTVENMILYASFTQGNPVNMGTVAATMSGGTISNVETGGTLTGGASTTNIGGLVGNKTGGTIHSSFAVNTITSGNATTHVGGLVGTNSGNLYNSYANTIISGTGQIGGLVGTNTGTVENCYAVVGSQTFPAFAYNNNGTIQICYADNANGYVGSGTAPTGHGTYGIVKDRKAIGYMYDDNAVTLVSGNNSYVASALAYNSAGTQIEKWPGLLSALNQWVNQDATHSSTYTPWFRPTSSNINGDLPVLGFPSDNCLGTIDADGKYLAYGSTYNSANGLDDLLYIFNNNVSDAASSLFLYGNATGVSNVPESQVKTFINEDACLIQADGAGDFINTTVGITFDNSCGNANSYYSNGTPDLLYDWHLMSTPLSNAKIGATYSTTNGSNYIPATGNYSSAVDISTLTNSYFPNGLPMQLSGAVEWDFYSYFEPEYHWINLKRNKNNHFHYEYNRNPGNTEAYQEDSEGNKHWQINYTGTDQSATTTGDGNCVFTPGKGYMMAISQDSYMSSTGTLNKGNVTIPITHTVQDPDWDGYFDQGANLIGNPYQAYLDLNKISGYNSFYVYDADEDQYVPFQQDQSKNPFTPSQYIHPHQAFFVMLPNDSDPHVNKTENFTFTPSMATATKEEHSYYRGDHVDYPLINLYFDNGAGEKNYAIIEVNRPEAGGAEKVDALNNANFDCYTRYDQKNYKLFFTPKGEQRVAVFFKTQEDGNFTLTWNTQNGEFDILTLIDNITGVEYDMLTNDSYTFEGKATDFAARFYVVFESAEEPSDNETDNEQPFAFNDGNGWIINGSGLLQVVDVMGRVLYTENLFGETNRVNLDCFAAGVYMLRLNGTVVKTQKVVISKH